MSTSCGLKCVWYPVGYKLNILIEQPCKYDKILLIILATCCMHNVLSHGYDFDPDNRFAYEVKSIFQNIQTIIRKSKYLLPKKCFDIRDKYTEYFLLSIGIAF